MTLKHDDCVIKDIQVKTNINMLHLTPKQEITNMYSNLSILVVKMYFHFEKMLVSHDMFPQN